MLTIQALVLDAYDTRSTGRSRPVTLRDRTERLMTAPTHAKNVDKPSLRADMKHALAQIPPLLRSLEEELVNAAIMATPEWQHARTVGLYHNKRIEFSVASLANAAFRAGKRVGFPRVEDMERGAMHFHEVRSWDDLSPGGFGLMEPQHASPMVHPEEIALMIVPGLAWMMDGRRLGHGGGFYDRLLARYPGVAWGVGFDCQLLPSLPQDPHDQAVDQVWMRSQMDLGDDSEE